jgi:hypothetical protein
MKALGNGPKTSTFKVYGISQSGDSQLHGSLGEALSSTQMFHLTYCIPYISRAGSHMSLIIIHTDAQE